jgi:hypothetical protein
VGDKEHEHNQKEGIGAPQSTMVHEWKKGSEAATFNVNLDIKSGALNSKIFNIQNNEDEQLHHKKG